MSKASMLGDAVLIDIGWPFFFPFFPFFPSFFPTPFMDFIDFMLFFPLMPLPPESPFPLRALYLSLIIPRCRLLSRRIECDARIPCACIVASSTTIQTYADNIRHTAAMVTMQLNI